LDKKLEGKTMRNTLLTTTALVLTAGIASADGHATISWSGTATAGVARAGGTTHVAAGKQSVSGALASTNAQADAKDAADPADNAAFLVDNLANMKARVLVVEDVIDSVTGAVTLSAGTSAALLRADIVLLTAGVNLMQDAVAKKAQLADLVKISAILDNVHGTAAGAVATGDFESYSEVSTTVKGSVTAGDMTMTAAVSVDAGKGYDFADDDGFDAAKTNGVSLDNVTLATSMGTFKIDENAVAHLVDAGDDATGDVLYTNTFGSLSFSAAIDLSKDTDAKAVKAVAATVKFTDATTTTANGLTTVDAAAVKAVAADVAWSAKVSMPVAGGTAYVAMDEEGGNIFGASTTLGGVGISFSSKLEALEEEISADRTNDIGLTYVMGATTLGATWNSVEDKDQWGISAAYAADGLTLKASTDEGSDWAVSGSMLLGTGASVVGGVNYTEDAYLGLSFSF